MWERMLSCNFLINKSIQTKYNSLQMDDKYFRECAYSGHFSHINLIITELTFIICDHLSMLESIE